MGKDPSFQEIIDLSLISPMKRDSITIIADILRAVESSRSARKTFIVYRANLNFRRLDKYLELLVVTGHVELIDSTEENRGYRITAKGHEFLARYEQLVGSVRARPRNEYEFESKLAAPA
jgi:predicted transcriptional regulator